MRRSMRNAGLVLIGILIGIQFVPVDRSNPEVRSDLRAPADVKAILTASCYDCHSHETRWPWYSRVAPVSWIVARHVTRGRADLNFSDWPLLDFAEAGLLRREIEDEIAAGRMPPSDYAFMHRDAALDDSARTVLEAWLATDRSGDEDSLW